MNIAIATAPRGMKFEEEIRLLKPALLYGDQVTLLSRCSSIREQPN